MRKVFQIIKKNLKLIIRSRSSGLVVILGPLLLVVLLGISFSKSSTYNIGVGVYSEEFNNLSNEVIDKMKDNQFSITKYSNADLCEDALKQDNVQICIGFPKDFEIKEGGNNNIVFHVDYSRINLAYLIIDLIEGKVTSQSSEIRRNLTTDLLNKIAYIESTLKTNRQYLGKMRDDAEKMNKLVTEVYSSISSMQLDFDIKDIALSDIVARSKNLIDFINDIDSFTSTKLESIKSLAGENSSLIYQKANETLSGFDSRIEILRNESGKLSDLITNAASKLSTLNTNLGEARTAKTSAITNLALAQELAKEMRESIDNLDNSSADMLNKISELTIRDPSIISEPITTTIKPVVKEKTHFNNMLPTLVVLIIMITGILLSSTLIVAEKRSKAYFRNYLTPTSNLSFNIGTYLSALFILILQLIVFLLAASYIFKVSGFVNFGNSAIVLLIVASLFITIGMLIGFIFKTEETNTLASITIVSILLFFSSTVLPLESMPKYIQSIARFNPFVISDLLLRQTMFFKYGLSEIWVSLLVLVEYFVAFFIILLLMQHFARRRLFHWHIKRK